MYKILFKNKINLLFLLISFLCLISVVGIDNVSFKSTEWLYIGESSQHQLGWHFFKNDIWRFPLGSNPNYGDEFSNSIVFADAIPILALFFKSLKSFIPGSFQYFSFWYFICFFLQLFFSFKIIKKFTGSDLYSVIGSFFFLISPIFIYRVDEHVALASQWLLLFALYLGLTQKIDKARLLWILLIILSSLINLYFTAMVVAVYSLLRIFNLKFEKENLSSGSIFFMTLGKNKQKKLQEDYENFKQGIQYSLGFIANLLSKKGLETIYLNSEEPLLRSKRDLELEDPITIEKDSTEYKKISQYIGDTENKKYNINIVFAYP